MSCPLCKNEEQKIVYDSIPTLVRCTECGFAHNLSQYSKGLYSDEYFTQKGIVTGRDFFSEWSRLYDIARFSQEIRNIKKFKKAGKVLDIGCATGSFMEMIYREGFEPYGTDVSEFAVNYIKTNFGFPAFCGFLSDISFEKSFFDVITLHHVLEHISDPVAFLCNDVKSILKNDGLLIIEVPNFGSLESRINKDNWEDLKPWEHLNQFTQTTLRTCLDKAGFKVKKTLTYTPHTHNLLWRYPQILSMIGLPDSIVKKIVQAVKTNLKKHNFGQSETVIGNNFFFDSLSRYVILPLNFVYSKLRINKCLVVYGVQK